MKKNKSEHKDESQIQSNQIDNATKQINNTSVLPQLSEEQKQNNTEQFKRFLKQTGISDAFQVIFAEIIDKKLKEEDSYKYTADRLREIGKGLNVELTKAKQDTQKRELQEKLKKK